MLVQCSISQIVGHAPQRGCNAMLEGLHRTSGNRCTYTLFIDTGLNLGEQGGAKYILFPWEGGLQR